MPSASVTGARPNSASCAPSTGVTQQSVPANRSTHTASGWRTISAASSSISARAPSLPGASSPRLQCRAAQSSRPSTAHTPCQNFSSSAPSAGPITYNSTYTQRKPGVLPCPKSRCIWTMPPKHWWNRRPRPTGCRKAVGWRRSSASTRPTNGPRTASDWPGVSPTSPCAKTVQRHCPPMHHAWGSEGRSC